MTGNTVPPPSLLGLNDPSLDPTINMNEWRLEQEATPALNDDPADILSKREEAANRRAALEAFIAVDKLTGHKYGKGIRYLFAIHVHGQDPVDIARQERSTPEQVQKAMKDVCVALRPVLAPFITKP